MITSQLLFIGTTELLLIGGLALLLFGGKKLPDLMTLILVTIPLYLLYEVSIRVVKWVE